MREIGPSEVLAGIAAVRKRPGMYIGDVHDGSGLHHMLWELVANALDEHLAGFARSLEVKLEGSAVTVADDGRGIPLHLRPDGRTYLEAVFTVLHGGGTADGHFPHVHVGPRLHGVGLAPVCALSEQVVVEVMRDGARHRQVFARGVPSGPHEALGPASASGTSVQLVPDPRVFPAVAFDRALIAERLQEMAYLNPDLRVHLNGAQLAGGDGLGTYCADLALGSELLAPYALRARGRHKKVDVDLALAWRREGDLALRSFVSQHRTRHGGSHERGFWEGMRRALGEFAPEQLGGMPTERFRRALAAGLVAVIHAGLYDPEFEGPTKDRLRSPAARSAVAHVVHESLVVYLSQYHRLREQLLQRVRA